MRKPPEEIVYTEGNGFDSIRDNIVAFPKRPKGDESMSDDHGKGHGHDHGGHGKKEAGLMSAEAKKWAIRALIALAGVYILLPMLLGVSCDLTWNYGKIGCAPLKRMEERQAGAAGSDFSVGDELRRRGGGNLAGPARRPVQGRQGLMPSVDCAAMGGIRTTNPNTGMPSCFVPN